MIYSSPSSIILNIFEPQKSISVKSRFACEILEAKLSKDGNFAIVKTGDTLLLCEKNWSQALTHFANSVWSYLIREFYVIGEVATGLTSEIAWLYSDKDKERFYFEYENVCVIYYESEMTIVEYGRDETLGSFRYLLLFHCILKVFMRFILMFVDERFVHFIKSGLTRWMPML